MPITEMRFPILIPYLSPELTTAILGQESVNASDMQTDPKRAVENLVPTQRTPSTVNEQSLPAPIQWNVAWSPYFRAFAVMAKLIAFWLL
jgi:hypothetical protein